jgi:Winged helix-turn helix
VSARTASTPTTGIFSRGRRDPGLTGVSYHRGHVWKLLRHRLGFRLLRPARRAVERDERAIAPWVAEDWP